MNPLRIGLVVVLIGRALIGYGQDTNFQLVRSSISASKSVEACGQCTVTETRTLADAKQCAYRSAVENALNSAGVERSVVSSTTLQSSQTNQEQSLVTFIEASKVSWQGGITGSRNVEEFTRIDNLGDVVVEHCANFQVRLYETRPDPGFQFSIEGLQNVYPSPAELHFKVQGPMGCMQAFLVEGDKAYKFFPNDSEPASCRPNGFTALSFPTLESQRIYEIFREPGVDGPWMVMFVFTKNDFASAVPVVCTARELLYWIESIEPEERYVHMHPFAFGR